MLHGSSRTSKRSHIPLHSDLSPPISAAQAHPLQLISGNLPEAYVSYIKVLINFINFSQGKPDVGKGLQVCWIPRH